MAEKNCKEIKEDIEIANKLAQTEHPPKRCPAAIDIPSKIVLN